MRRARMMVSAGAAGLVVGHLAGCSAPENKAAVRPAAQQVAAPGPAAEPVLSAVERSALREQALEALVRGASDPMPQMRANALEALASTPTRLVPLLPSALADANPGVRAVAAALVGRLRRCELAALVEPLTTDESEFVRASAVFALGRCDPSRDLGPLALVLNGSNSTRARAHAAYLLGELGNASAIPMLRQAAGVDVPRASPIEVRLLQLQIAEALYKLGDQSQISTLHSALLVAAPEDLEAAALAVQILGEVGSRRSVPDIVNLLAWSDEDGSRMPAEVRLGAAAALAKLGRRDGWIVAQEFERSESAVLRAQAAHVFGRVGRTDDLGSLRRLLGDDDGLVRIAAAGAIAGGAD